MDTCRLLVYGTTGVSAMQSFPCFQFLFNSLPLEQQAVVAPRRAPTPLSFGAVHPTRRSERIRQLRCQFEELVHLCQNVFVVPRFALYGRGLIQDLVNLVFSAAFSHVLFMLQRVGCWFAHVGTRGGRFTHVGMHRV